MCLSAVVHLSRIFWDDTRNGTTAEKTQVQLVMRQLVVMTVWCHITTPELPGCEIEGQDAERLVEVLVQCPALAVMVLVP